MNKGFTMIELLAVVIILGILTLLGIGAVSMYREHSSNKAFDMLMENSSSAAENYFMDNYHEDSVSLDTLVDKEYLENSIDPWSKDSICKGEVKRELISKANKDSIDAYKMIVQIKCVKGCVCKVYPGKGDCTCDSKYN